ncbi:GAF domain-containing protein [Alkalibacillus salilacus]|uniref:GAF domain-containing protein n=1 Tax=Alkalibacillus salilacus TaxID=284582 RepID=UPI0027D88D65|nr:GAF domain-containing protein [Alkalibacillus salilacus]
MTSFDFQTAVEQLKTDLEVDIVLLALAEQEDSFCLKWKCAAGNSNDRYRRVMLKSGKGVVGNVFKTGKPVVIPDVDDHPIRNELYNYPMIQFEKIKSFIALPLWQSYRVKAVLLIGSRTASQLQDIDYDAVIKRIGYDFGPLQVQELMT